MPTLIKRTRLRQVYCVDYKKVLKKKRALLTNLVIFRTLIYPQNPEPTVKSLASCKEAGNS